MSVTLRIKGQIFCTCPEQGSKSIRGALINQIVVAQCDRALSAASKACQSNDGDNDGSECFSRPGFHYEAVRNLFEQLQKGMSQGIDTSLCSPRQGP